ncbi:MAG: hypothetical protein H6605_06995 [Flavobacteriales bacterium]|nr:hypothetical protein [Flavobacteriales bacterium]
MKNRIILTLCLIVFYKNACTQTLKRIDLDTSDFFSGHYHVVEPQSDNIEGVLVLIAGFGQRAEDTPPETKMHNVSYVNNILTIFFAAGNKLYADSMTQAKISTVLIDVMKRYNVKGDKFVIGGFSAGGMIALRYVELCNEFPKRFPVKPKGVFVVDSPIDFFTIWSELEEAAKYKYSEVAVEEAERAMKLIKEDHGDPVVNFTYYAGINPFSMDKKNGENEKYLSNTAVRVYHDVDISWWLQNRNQSVSGSNYLVTSELINRLILMGNKRAEFMQSYQTGYRSNGQRHPHSWSIVNEVELIQWMNNLLN